MVAYQYGARMSSGEINCAWRWYIGSLSAGEGGIEISWRKNSGKKNGEKKKSVSKQHKSKSMKRLAVKKKMTYRRGGVSVSNLEA